MFKYTFLLLITMQFAQGAHPAPQGAQPQDQRFKKINAQTVQAFIEKKDKALLLRASEGKISKMHSLSLYSAVLSGDSRSIGTCLSYIPKAVEFMAKNDLVFEGTTPLFWAVFNKDPQITVALLCKGFDPDNKKQSSLSHPLDTAILYGRRANITYLLYGGADKSKALRSLEQARFIKSLSNASPAIKDLLKNPEPMTKALLESDKKCLAVFDGCWSPLRRAFILGYVRISRMQAVAPTIASQPKRSRVEEIKE